MDMFELTVVIANELVKLSFELKIERYFILKHILLYVVTIFVSLFQKEANIFLKGHQSLYVGRTIKYA